jgi:nickel/cobalt exporter
VSVISIITSLGLGALHAFEPGHGKTFLASYSLSNNINKKEIIKIISSMAISHSLLLLVLVIAIPVLLPKLEETIHIYIQVFASILILFVGLKMFLKWRKKEETQGNCSCGQHHSDEEHNKSVLFVGQNKNLSNISFKTSKTTGINLVSNKTKKHNEISKKNNKPILVGIINGIMPCPSALAVVGIAFAFSSAWTISFIMLAYVFGFIVTMFCFLMVFVIFKNKLINPNTNNSKSQKKVQLISAIIIICSGFYYLFLAFNHSH